MSYFSQINVQFYVSSFNIQYDSYNDLLYFVDNLRSYSSGNVYTQFTWFGRHLRLAKKPRGTPCLYLTGGGVGVRRHFRICNTLCSIPLGTLFGL